MHLKSITIEGFGLFRDRETINLSEITMASVSGVNQGGKTTLLRAIEYALFGARKGEPEVLVSAGAGACKVELTLAGADGDYVITRRHRGSTQQLSFITPSGDLGSRDIVTTQSTIESVVGTSRDVARATWLATEDLAGLCAMKADARRNLLSEAFGLGEFAERRKRADAQRKSVEADLARLRGQMVGLGSELPLDPRLAGLDDDAVMGQLHLIAQAGHIDAVRQRGQQAATQLSQMNAVLAEAQRGRDFIANTSGTLEQLDAQCSEATVADANNRDAVSQLESSLRTASANRSATVASRAPLAAGQVGNCSACGQTLTQQAKETLLGAVDAQIASLDAQIASLSADLSAAQQVAERSGAALSAVVAQRNNLADSLRRAQQAIDRATQAESMVEALRQAVAEAESLADHPQPVVADEASLRRELALREQRKANAAQLESLRAQEETMARRASHLALLVEAWSPRGLPMAILRSLLDVMVADANSRLRSMGSDLTVALSADASTVGLSVDGRGWESASGMERFYVGLAMRQALGAAVAQHRHGAGLDVLMVDEGFDVLDEAHKDAAMVALSSLSDAGHQVVLVTQDSEVIARCRQGYVVDVSTGSSRVRPAL